MTAEERVQSFRSTLVKVTFAGTSSGPVVEAEAGQCGVGWRSLGCDQSLSQGRGSSPGVGWGEQTCPGDTQRWPKPCMLFPG